MSVRENSDATNLDLVKVGRSKTVKVAGDDGSDKDAAAYKRLMALFQEEARPVGYLAGRGALDHDDLQYLRETTLAEEEAERLRQHREKRAFAALRHAASSSEATPASPSTTATVPAWLAAKPKQPKRQESLVKTIVTVKPKKLKVEGKNGSVESGLEQKGTTASSPVGDGKQVRKVADNGKQVESSAEDETKNVATSLLGLPYDGSDDE